MGVVAQIKKSMMVYQVEYDPRLVYLIVNFSIYILIFYYCDA